MVLHAEEPHLVVRCVALLVVADASFNAHNDVAPTRIQSSIELQHAPGILVVPIAQTVALVLVDRVRQKFGISLGEHILERIRHVVVRVVAERCRFRITSTIVRSIAAVGTEQDVGQRVGLPLQSHVSV